MPVRNIDVFDQDRLPWLESAEPDRPAGAGLGRVVLLVMLGLAVLAAVIWGVYRLQGPGAAGDGALIAAPEGDYKVRPDEPGGLKVKGEGAAAVATSAGQANNGAIDLKAVPEAPIDGRRAPQPLPSRSPGTRNIVAEVPGSGGRLRAPAPVAARREAVPDGAAGGSLVQLGAYPSEAAANSAWTSFSRRFSYLEPLGKLVQPVAAEGRTLYRLRVDAGSANQAADLCGRLKVAGEGCFIAS